MGKRPAKIKYQEETFFIVQVGKMLQHGLALPVAIDYIARTRPTLRTAARRLGHLLRDGSSLAAGMRQVGFSASLCDQVAMAQANGRLSHLLMRVGRFQQGQRQRMQKLQKACVYPMFLLGFVGVILLLVRLVIRLQFAALGTTGETGFSRWLTTGFGVLVLVGCLLGWSGYRCWHAPMTGQRVARIFHWPVVGSTLRCYIYHTLLYDLSMLLGNGWTMKEIIALQSAFGEGSLVAALLKDMETEFRTGTGFVIIVDRLVYFPSEVASLLAQGSSAQELAGELEVLADQYYEQMLTRIDKLITRIQPACFLLVALSVLCIYGELLLPIYGQMQILN
jgi:type II secretory pathway component PulF